MTMMLLQAHPLRHIASFMSQGDTKVYNANVVDHVVSYDELVSRLASMTMSLENKIAKTLKLENENSFLKTT